MSETTENPQAGGRCAPAPGSESYAHEWTITIKADSLRGAMDAVWNCWEAWRDGSEPVGGVCPESMGNRMTYDVNKTKQPSTPNT